MTVKDISTGLYWLLSRQSYQVQIPNYTPLRWWECDHYAVTKAGLAVEFEIKMSVADFRADAKKQRDGRVMKDGWDIVRDEHGKMVFHNGEKKHEQLAAKCADGPSRFYFVVPDGMIQAADVPEWAGLLWAHERPHQSHPTFLTVKDAPRLHREKVKPEVLENIRSTFYYRFWTLRNKMKALPEIAEYSPPDVGILSDADLIEI